MEPIISVIIPVYNTEKYLNQCLDTLVNQTYKNLEIILVDDGSTDNSLDILNSYSNVDSRIKVISQTNKGPGAARNKGLENISGDYISILDSDDFYKLDMYEKMLGKLIETNADVVICKSYDYDNIKDRGRINRCSLKEDLLPEKDVFCYRDIADHIFDFCVGWSWDKLYKASVIKENTLKFQELKNTDDAYFVFISLIKAKSITTLRDVFIYHRVNLKTSTSVTREGSWDCFAKAVEAVYDELQRTQIFSDVERSFVNWVLDFGLWNFHTLSEETQKFLYDFLKKTYFEKYHLEKYPREYFFNPYQYELYLNILQLPYEQFKRKNISGNKLRRFFVYLKCNGLKKTFKKIFK